MKTESKEIQRLRLAIWAVIDTFEGAVAAFEQYGKDGQHVPYHGEFSSVGPSTVGQMRRWAKELRDALRGEWPMTRDDFEALFPDTDPTSLDHVFREREP